ncbi:MAG: hypothetical protein HYU66_10230 [Armatimonadetes bacterium]|nr:hypothetical protein [Armatimonadota bacterium]
MQMAYKHNWDEARERLLAFWNMAIIDRPCIAVTAPNQSPRPLAPPADDRVKWTDPEYVAQSYDVWHEATWFGGEAVPATSLMVGYCFGYGARLHFAEQTVWQEPIIESWDAAPPLVLDEEDWAWRQIQAVVARCAEVSAGKWLTGWPNIHQPNDHLALLRGTEALLLDMVDDPATVKRALRQLLDNWYAMHQRLTAVLSPTQEGSVTWLPVWCPWPHCVTLQSDVSCTLSPAMFEEFIAPELEELAAWLDGAIYHLDGPGALQHLDRLLAIEGIHAIQWTPGTGNAGGLAWIPLYQRIQAAGKGVVASLAYDEVEPALRELRPEGLFILTSAPSVDAAEELLGRVSQRA